MLPKIEVPVHEMILPSTGKEIKFRPFLVKEQKLFLMASESGEEKEVLKSVKQVISNCVFDELDIDKLPTFDIEYIFLQIRARSIGEIVELRYSCNNEIKDEEDKIKKCGNVVPFEVNLLDIEIQKNSEHNKEIKLSENLGLVMKYPSVSSLEKIDITKEENLISVLSSSIDYIYDSEQTYYTKDVPKKEVDDFVESMKQSDLLKVQNFFETMPKLSKTHYFECKKCNYTEDIVIEGLQSFFV